MAVQIAVVSGMALLITVVVYSLVAGIVKIDDLGLYLVKVPELDAWGRVRRKIGAGLLRLAPLLMKTLSVVGTAAMFLVGGGILMHGLPGTHELTHHLVVPVQSIPFVGDVASALMPTLMNAIVGVLAGGLLVGMATMGKSFLVKLKVTT